jgi:hypothetical protein
MPNPSLKLTRYGRHCKPGTAPAVLLSRTGLTTPAYAGSLARTLGSTKTSVPRTSRFSAYRRELSSHDAAEPQEAHAGSRGQRH